MEKPIQQNIAQTEGEQNKMNIIELCVNKILLNYYLTELQ